MTTRQQILDLERRFLDALRAELGASPPEHLRVHARRVEPLLLRVRWTMELTILPAELFDWMPWIASRIAAERAGDAALLIEPPRPLASQWDPSDLGLVYAYSAPAWAVYQAARERERAQGYTPTQRLLPCTYVIRCSSTGLYKIGQAHEPAKRLVELQVGSAAELTLVAVLHRLREAALHARFADKRIRGEWFALTRAEIEALQREDEGG